MTDQTGRFGRVKDEPEVAEFYANVVVANVTPWELNLIFARAGVPVNAGESEGFRLDENVKYVARVAVPISLLPLVAKLLEEQLKAARSSGIIREAGVPAVAPRREAKKEKVKS